MGQGKHPGITELNKLEACIVLEKYENKAF